VHGRVQFGAKLAAEVLANYRKALFFPDSPAARHPVLAQGVSG
jgi:hypothetical protein